MNHLWCWILWGPFKCDALMLLLEQSKQCDHMTELFKLTHLLILPSHAVIPHPVHFFTN